MTRATTGPTTRRAVLAGACATCAAGVLTACAGTSASGSDSGSGSDAQAAPPGTALTSTADVPVGGGTVLPDQRVVVVQPAAGTFAAYSSTCTHTGCTVRDVSGGTINCPCHGSKFAIADGSVVKGPATRPLAAKKVAVTGTSIALA